MMRRLTIRRHKHAGEARTTPEPDVYAISASDLGGVFAAPNWLRDLGVLSWLLAGVAIVVSAGMALMALTQAIVMPVLTAGILAATLSPIVGALGRRGVARGAATAIVLILVVAIGAGVGLIVVSGITSQSAELTSKLVAGADKVQGWLEDAGIKADAAQRANDGARDGVGSGFRALVEGLATGLQALASLVVFLSFTVLSLIFLLKDGPTIRRWTEDHLGVPPTLAHTITGRVLTSLRGYFAGVTAIAAFNALVVGAGAWILGVPLAGSIAVVTFVGAYIPYLGAWTAGGFSVLVALGAAGPEEAIAIAIVSLLANGILQQLVQPIAFGATLGIHPLAVLIVTIAGGSLFGMIGLVLAAPLTAAAVKIAADIARAKVVTAQTAEQEPPPTPA